MIACLKIGILGDNETLGSNTKLFQRCVHSTKFAIKKNGEIILGHKGGGLHLLQLLTIWVREIVWCFNSSFPCG